MRHCHNAIAAAVRGIGASSRLASTLETLEERRFLSVSMSPDGWTVVTPSEDTRTIYVSSSLGDDANSGLSPDQPVKTIAKGKSLVRNGFPDWLLLRRGDQFLNENFGVFNRVSGRSPDEPLLISSYGEDPNRPVIMTGDKSALKGSNSDFIFVMGLHFYAHTRDPESPDYFRSPGGDGINWQGGGSHILIEDCEVEWYDTNIVFQDIDGGRPSDITIRRSVIHDAYANSSHSQGIFTVGVDGALIEENFIDHNGWHDDPAIGPPTIFNHNIYISSSHGGGGMIVRNNVIARGASHGLQLRTGGIAEGNLFIDNAIHMNAGRNAVVRGNVLLGGRNISNEERGWGFDLIRGEQMLVENNIIAHKPATVGNGPAFLLAGTEVPEIPEYHLQIRNNIVYDWNGTALKAVNPNFDTFEFSGNSVQLGAFGKYGQEHRIVPFAPEKYTATNNVYQTGAKASAWFRPTDASEVSFDQWVALSGETGSRTEQLTYPDASRDVASYNASRGKEASLDAFLEEARLQSLHHWRPEYTAQAVIDYVREGFGLLPLTQIYVTPGEDLRTSEQGDAVSVQVVLSRQPSANVVIPVSTTNPAEGTTSIESLIFTPENWNIPQIVTVIGVDDSALDDDQSYKLVFGAAQSADAKFNGLVAEDVELSNLNDDVDDVRPVAHMPHGNTIRIVRSNLGAPKGGYLFTVHYNDDDALDLTSIRTGNLVLTGAGSFSQIATLSHAFASGGGMTVAYRFSPPEGTWDTGDNGFYRLQIGASPVRDVAGNAAKFNASALLLVNIVEQAQQPATIALSAPALTGGGVKSPYVFDVTYMPDKSGIRARSINKGDLIIFNSKGQKATLQLISKRKGEKPGSIIACYAMAAPGGSWDVGDNGSYMVKLMGKEVRDADGNYLPGGKLGYFSVKLPKDTDVSAVDVEDYVTWSPDRSVDGSSGAAMAGLFNSEDSILTA